MIKGEFEIDHKVILFSEWPVVLFNHLFSSMFYIIY
jgi:hypothetical protein